MTVIKDGHNQFDGLAERNDKMQPKQQTIETFATLIFKIQSLKFFFLLNVITVNPFVRKNNTKTNKSSVGPKTQYDKNNEIFFYIYVNDKHNTTLKQKNTDIFLKLKKKFIKFSILNSEKNSNFL